MIRIDQLVKRYRDFTAVDDLSFQVGAGEILGLVGPNGAGKTTTLRCLAGIIPPSSGRIALDGHDLAAEPIEARRALGYVPEEPLLFEHMTVWDHFLVVARLYGVRDGNRRSQELLRDFDLAAMRKSFPGEMSRGNRQKLMVACALLHRPRALILDEPLTGLDPAAMRRVKHMIVQSAAGGAAVIISSHLLHLVEEICGRVLIVHRGKKRLDGTLEEIRRALPDLHGDADLEEIFLRATEEVDSP